GGHRRGLEARGRAGAAAYAAADRAAALRADPRHGGGGAARYLPLPRDEPARGAAQPASGRCRLSWARASWGAGGENEHGYAGVQRGHAAAAAEVSGSAAFPGGGAAGGTAFGDGGGFAECAADCGEQTASYRAEAGGAPLATCRPR